MDNLESKNSLLLSLYNYLKKPDYYLVPSQARFKQKLFDVIRYWSLGILVAVITGLAATILLNSTGVDGSQNLLQDFFLDNSAIFIIIVVFFYGPITEEITFRLALRYSPFKFSFFLSFALFLLLETFVSLNKGFGQIFEKLALNFKPLELMAFYFVSLVFLGFLLGLFFSRANFSKKIEFFYVKNFPYIFYGSTLVFATVHFFNFANFQEIWLALPFLVAPQLFLGTILAFIRMRYSFWWSTFYHFLHNALVSLPIILMSQVSDDNYQILQNGTDLDLLNIPMSQKIFILAGVSVSVMISILFIIAFYSLVKNHRDSSKP